MPDDMLPAIPDDGDGEILTGEIVGGPARPGAIRATAVVLGVVRHEHVRTTGRHASYIVTGAVVLAKRAWEGRTTTRYERWLRGAEATGDIDRILEVENALAKFRKDRHQRRMDWAELPLKYIVLLPTLALAAFGILAALGVLMAIATRHIREVVVPVVTVARVVEFIVIVVSIAWSWMLLAAIAVLLTVLYRTGRAYALSAGWRMSPKQADQDRGLVPTADSIVLALRNLPVPPLKSAFKEGWLSSFHTLPVKDGEGYSAVFSLPLGATAGMIADQVEVFARNLHRAKTEVWPTDAERGNIAPAGYVSVWIANPGVLDRPAPDYPLLHEGTADVFRGIPAGVSPRGDDIDIPVVGNNFAVGGIMGQGKSNACRVLFLGAALDPLAELWAHVFAYNADFDAYAPRLARYVKGAEAEQVDAAMESLNELYAEVSRREGRLSELGVLKVSRNVAMRYPDMRPRLALFSECHELFGHRKHGDEATDLAAAIIRRARKTGVWMGFDTQDARKDAIPPKIIGLVSVNACFAVKTWRANDGFLGDGSFQAGIRATELRPGRDVGRSLITGVSDAQFELLKWYYIRADDEKGVDDAAPVIARAVHGAAAGTALGGAAPLAIEVRDLLEDLAEVTRGTRAPVRIADLPARLRDLAEHWGPYRTLTGTALREQLEDYGVRTTNTGNVPRLDPASLRDVLGRRGELGD
jgi:S-DNA-T family DNA segregation ATPase FtsK/SpoIIIE